MFIFSCIVGNSRRRRRKTGWIKKRKEKNASFPSTAVTRMNG